MSDGRDTKIPTEAQVHAASPSALASSAPSHVPTPGVSSSVARSPTMPTLPDADPAALTLAISHLANTLWLAPFVDEGGAPPMVGPTTVGQTMAADHAALPTSTGVHAGPLDATRPHALAAPHASAGAPTTTSPVPAGAAPSAPHEASSSSSSSTHGGAPPGVHEVLHASSPALTTGALDVDAPSHAPSSSSAPERAARDAARPLPNVPDAPAAARAPHVDEADARDAHPFFVEPRFDALLASPRASSDAGVHDPFALDFTLPLIDDRARDDGARAAFAGEPARASSASRAPSSTDVPRTSAAAVSAPRAPVVSAGSLAGAPRLDVPHAHEPAVGASLPTSDVMTSGAGLDAHAVKREFPILDERVHGRRLVWLDNAATTQKPRVVIERLKHFYEHENSNIHRAAHALAARATDAYEGARETVRRFLNAPSSRDIVFVRGATEGMNLVAKSYGARHVRAGDEIVITHLEHHANIVPWQMLCEEKGARLVVAPVDDTGQVILERYERLLSEKTRIVSFTAVSNALGTITPARQMIEMAHRHGACVVLDAAQSVSHLRTDVQQLDCDFLVFSGHKIFAPTGIGAVYGKSALLDETPPWQGGGNMIQDVTFERTVYQPAPMRFEAGTGNIADAVALGTALDWLTRLGLENVARHEHALLEHATALLETIPGLTIVGTAKEKAAVISFVVDGHSTHDVSTALDREGIATRGGHHCAQPILRRFGHESTVRASFAPYNTHDDVVALYEALRRIVGAR